MNNWRRRLALGLVFAMTGKAFDWATDGLPYAPLFWLLYYGGAATVDLLTYKVVHLFVSGRLQRDIEALCIASVAVNALGWALVLADTPPDLYNVFIAGLNYVLAVKLLLGDRNAVDILGNRFNWSRAYLVLRNISGPKKYAPPKEE